MEDNYILIFIIGLIAGDFISFATYLMCRFYDEVECAKNVKKNSFIKDISSYCRDYFQLALRSFSEKNIKFLASYIIVDIVTIAVTFAVFLNFGSSIKSLLALAFCYSLLLLSFVDAKTQLLPDIITKPLIVFGIIVGYFEVFVDFKTSIYGALAGYWVFWTINTLFRAIRKKEGMGYGDFKLLAAIGSLVGVYQLPLIIMMSSVLGIIAAIFIALLPKNDFFQPNPFGPALAVAGIVSLFWGDAIIMWYLSLITI